ncbi:hypothetical protein K469DRAFT_728133 [Zopfia rhizophila CBS 207.26]|uniref:Fe2OG dioxygenase domain-containing protein n=1 Tax=Zopfia rhizophila CBS 207.26 TaxID=1314779 RepID=A0A6A6DTU8_9PEZI|nr:hypothetical protein K469DRAFT_728133 [Zopfia rhizophila CBS 207.26]
MSGSSLLPDLDPLAAFRVPFLPPTFYYIPNFISEEEEISILQKIPSQRWVTLSHRRLQAHPSTLTASNTLLAAPLPPYLVNPVIERLKALKVFKNTPHKEPNHVLINEYKKREGIMPHEDGSAYADVVATVSLGASICLEITQKPGNGHNEDSSRVEREKKAEGKSAGGKGSKNDGEDNDEYEGATATPSQTHASQYKIPTRILQEPRSLLITTLSAYTDLLHGISPIGVDENLSPDTVANWFLLAEPDLFEEAGGKNERSTRISLTYRDVLKVSSAASKVLGGLGKR